MYFCFYVCQCPIWKVAQWSPIAPRNICSQLSITLFSLHPSLDNNNLEYFNLRFFGNPVYLKPFFLLPNLQRKRMSYDYNNILSYQIKNIFRSLTIINLYCKKNSCCICFICLYVSMYLHMCTYIFKVQGVP